MRGFRYDAARAPEPASWLAIDEQTRVELVLSFLTKTEQPTPLLRTRAALWAVVENQLAMAVPAVVETLARLADEGLARSKALALVARELLEHLQAVSAERADDYAARLARITASDALAGR